MRSIPESDAAIQKTVDCLRAGGTVVHATETCYGIAADLTNEAAVRALFEAKKRPFDQPVSALFADLASAETYVELSPLARALAAKHLPGPLTLVLPKKRDAPPLWLTVTGEGKDPWIGVRISSHPTAAKLAKLTGVPLATTSANMHGKENPYTHEDIESQWGEASPMPLFLEGGKLAVRSPSTVVRIDGDIITVLRQGDLRF